MEALVLAAGKGTRMRSEKPKVLHEILGLPLLGYVLKTLSAMGVKRPVVVIGSGAEQVRSFLQKKSERLGSNPVTILQKEQKGTGHAVMVSRTALRGEAGDILIWPGDMPLLKTETLQNFFRHHREAKAEVSVLSSLQIDPKGYGRIIRAGGRIIAIREELDATEAERRIQEVNTGVYLFKRDQLFSALDQICPANAKKEYYLTDTIEILAKTGCRMEAFPLAGTSEAQGINSRKDLAEAMRVMNQREIEKHQEKGVTFVAPDQTFVAPGVEIGPDTVIYPWTYIEADVQIGKKCSIGPFAKIRAHSKIGDRAIIGSFVEVNRSQIGPCVLAKHLAYLGDAQVGAGTNIGAGTITANFDGKKKHRTKIGKNVLIGSDTVLVAPVVVEDGAKTGAGTVVTRGSRIRKGEVVVGVPFRSLTHKNKTASKKHKG